MALSVTASRETRGRPGLGNARSFSTPITLLRTRLSDRSLVEGMNRIRMCCYQRVPLLRKRSKPGLSEDDLPTMPEPAMEKTSNPRPLPLEMHAVKEGKSQLPQNIDSSMRSTILRSFKDALGIIAKLPFPGIDSTASGLSVILERLDAMDLYKKSLVSFKERLFILVQLLQQDENGSYCLNSERILAFSERLNRSLRDMEKDLARAENQGRMAKFINSTDDSISLLRYSGELDSIVADWSAAVGKDVRDIAINIDAKLSSMLEHEESPDPQLEVIVRNNTLDMSGHVISGIVGVNRVEICNNVITMPNGGSFGSDLFGPGSQRDPNVLNYLLLRHEQRRQLGYPFTSISEQ